ncbi:unnamed protein product [Hydatigera taeniaeformis]|uniref:Endoplasmic reticulum lectin 1 n=1 Tax=Hydatigena taeniaeformis TaxID=6205 RepID=A0A0R3X2E1_HYDTA|nr:unnamed protein product [Hydatigera taeniaeformis]
MYLFTAVICAILFAFNTSGDFDISDEYTYSMIWDASSNSQVSSRKVQEGVLHPSVLLADFFKAYPCIFKVEGFWTYELCHDKHIRQFRAEGAGPKLTRIVKEFYLGRISGSKEKSIQINGRDFFYYSVEYDDGTECDLTGAPRRASVLYVCLEESDGELFQVSELETCVYQLIVFTRHLCASPRYNVLVSFYFKSHKVYSNPITCVPHDENTSRKPRALISLEKEKEELIALGVSDMKVLNELHLDQRRELQSFLDGETCLTGGAGWWRHEVCYGGRITQYHESGERTEIVLGKWDEAAHLHWIKQNSLREYKQNISYLSFCPLPSKLTQFYDNGDFCEEIKAPRSVRLSFV